MDEKRPKRRKDKYNPYTIINKDGRYYLSFADGEKVAHEIEIDKSLYDEFDKFELDDLSFLNVTDRHIEQSEQTEASLHRKAVWKPESVEDAVLKRMEKNLLHKSIAMLPEIQRRRVCLYFFGGLTYEQIAELEGCTKMAIKFSIDTAISKLKEILKYF